jgi:hypothetical protein
MTTSIPLRVFFATSALKKYPGKRRELMERTTKIFLLDDTSKALKNQGFSEKQFQSGHSFSSQARYDHFDTSPQHNYSVFSADNLISSQPRYDHFDTATYIVSPIAENDFGYTVGISNNSASTKSRNP